MINTDKQRYTLQTYDWENMNGKHTNITNARAEKKFLTNASQRHNRRDISAKQSDSQWLHRNYQHFNRRLQITSQTCQMACIPITDEPAPPAPGHVLTIS